MYFSKKSDLVEASNITLDLFLGAALYFKIKDYQVKVKISQQRFLLPAKGLFCKKRYKKLYQRIPLAFIFSYNILGTCSMRK